MNRLCIFCWLAAIASAPSADERQPPPLAAKELAQVRSLVARTQSRITLLQARLDERQRELGQIYSHYELDVAAAEVLQADIVTLQRQLLASHHAMQVELRRIVSAERFDFLRQRLSRVVGPDAEPPRSSPAPTEVNPGQDPPENRKNGP